MMLPFHNVTFVVIRLSSSFIEILTREDDPGGEGGVPK